MHAITSKISPLPNSSGIEVVEAEDFKLQCFQSLTGLFYLFYFFALYTILRACHKLFVLRVVPPDLGTKFLLLTDPPHPNVDQALRRIYDLYGDFVMKNPFHTPEMPIRSEMFDLNVQKLIKNVGSG